MRKKVFEEGDVILMENFEEVDDTEMGHILSKDKLSAFELDMLMNR